MGMYVGSYMRMNVHTFVGRYGHTPVCMIIPAHNHVSKESFVKLFSCFLIVSQTEVETSSRSV